MRAMSRAAVVVATVVLLGTGTAYGAELPRGAATAATEAARQAAEAGVALDAAKAAATAAAAKAAQTNDPADIAAAAAATAAQATAQQAFDAKTAADANYSREAASLSKLNKGTSTEGTSSLPDDTALPPVDKSANVEYVGHSRGPSQNYVLPLSTPPTAAELTAYN